MNSLELAYTVTLLRRLVTSADVYMEDCIGWRSKFKPNLEIDIKQAKALLKAYDDRLIKQAQKEAFYETKEPV